jgi:hypothetical protein
MDPRIQTIEHDSVCSAKVYGSLAGTSRWQGMSGCKLKPAVRQLRADGTVIAYWCKRHTPRGNNSVILEVL